MTRHLHLLIVLVVLLAGGVLAYGANPQTTPDAPLYLLTYDHGGLVLWGRDHFVKYLHSATDWLDRYPSFKIGLDNEAYTYDKLAEEDPAVIDEIRGYLSKYQGRFGIGTCTYGQPLSVSVNEESNIRQIEYALAADRKYFGTAPDVYLMSEHAMHAQIPQLLKGFGLHGAIMRTHLHDVRVQSLLRCAHRLVGGTGRVARRDGSHVQRRRGAVRQDHGR